MNFRINRFLRHAIASTTWLLALNLAHAQGPYTLYFDLNGTTAGSGVAEGSNTLWWSAISNANQWAVNDGSGTVETTNVNAPIGIGFNNPSITNNVKSVVFSAGNDLSGIDYMVRTEGRNFFIQDLTVSSGNLTLEQSGNQIAFGVASNPTITVNNGASLALTSKNLNMNGRTVTMDIQGSATASTIGFLGSLAASGALIKNGSGSLSVTGPSTYNGATTVNGGTLKIDDPTGLSFGAGVAHNVVQGAVTVTPGTGMTSATLDLNGNATFNKPITLNGTATGGNSARLINSNIGTTAVLDSGVSRVAFSSRGTAFKLADLTTSPLTLTGVGSGAKASITALQTVPGSFSLENGGTGYAVGNDISVNGGGATQTVLYRVKSVDANGTILTLDYQRAGIGYDSSSGLTFTGGTGTGATFTFNDNFEIRSIQMTDAGTGYTSHAPTLSCSTGIGFAGTAAISSLSLTGTNNEIGGDGNLTINSAIRQTASGAGFTKIGDGSLALTAINTYTGDTNVTAGTLILGDGTNNSSLSDEADVIIASGAILQLNYSPENADTIDALWLGGVQQSPGIYGAGTYSGVTITGTGSLFVTNRPPADPFANWFNTNHPGIAFPDHQPGADPDNDGIANLLEYVLQGGDPSASSTAILPTLDASGANFVFTFYRRTAATGTTQIFEHSTTLEASSWTPIAIPGGPGVSIIPNDPSAGIDKVEITVDKGINTKLFGRLKVMLLDPVEAAPTYYVELTGNDSNSGLSGAPWRTLEKAFQSVTPNQGEIIQVGPGTFTANEILTLKSGVSLIGAGSTKTKILVNHHFNLTDAVPNANPHVDTFPEHFVLQVEGSNQTLKGFSLDGQEKRCHGGIFAARSSQVLFEDLGVSNFRYCGLWVIDAHDTTLRFSNFKDNTYGHLNFGESGAVQYHRGKNLTIHDNRIEETGNIKPDRGGYAMKAQDRRYSVSAANVLEGFQMYNNVLIVPASGAWVASGFAAEFLGMALKDCEIHNNVLNGTLSLAGPALSGQGIRIHHNFFNIGRGRYGYGVEANVSNVEIDHNYFFGGLHPIAVFGRDPVNHNIHHNLFEAVAAGQFEGRALLRYLAVPVTNLRFINNTVIDNGSIGKIFDFHPSTTFEIRNNLLIRPGEPKDIWGPEIPGGISHNYFSNITPRGEHAMTGDPGITLVGENPLRPPYYTIQPDSPILNSGEIISPLTDGFTGSAPDIGAIQNGVTLTIPVGLEDSFDE